MSSRWVDIDGELMLVAPGLLGYVDDDDPGAHVGEDCGCGDWEDGDIDPGCWALAVGTVGAAWGVWRDEGAHGVSLVAWMPRGGWVPTTALVDPNQMSLFGGQS